MNIVRMLSAALVVAGGSLGAAAQSSDQRTILGVTIGEPIDLPNCTGSVFSSAVEINRTCFDYTQPSWQGSITNYRIGIPAGSRPTFLKSNYFDAGVVDGRLEIINIPTTGVEGQEAAYSQLVEKFGAPGFSRREPLQNRFGATFEALRATWTVGNVSVRFNGVGQRLDGGFILIITQNGDAALKDWSKERQSKEPRL